jgi:spore germination protein KC
MNRRCVLVILLLVTIIGAGGCWDRRELESFGFVQALGLDMEPPQPTITVTAVIAIPSKLGAAAQGGGGNSEGGGVMVVTTKAPSIYEAFNLMNTTINREITLQQNQLLIIGEAMAKSGVGRWIDNLVRFREMRRTLLVFVSRGKAADIFSFKPLLEKNPAEYISDLVNHSNHTGMFPKVILNNFLERYEAFAQQNYAPLIAKISLVKPQEQPTAKQPDAAEEANGDSGGKDATAEPKPDELRLIGTAVFKKDKVVGSLDIYETQAFLMLTNQFGEAFLTIRDPLRKDSIIAFHLLGNNAPLIVYQKRNGVNHFTIRLKLEANLVSIQSDIDYTQPSNEAYLAQKIAAVLKSRVEKVILKVQQEYHSDIFGFGAKIRNTMLTSTEWDNYRWDHKFPDAKFNVAVKVAIRRVGVQFHPPLQRE